MQKQEPTLSLDALNSDNIYAIAITHIN